MADDEKCFPWDLSQVRAATVNVSSFQVPSKARSEFEKACAASTKHKFDEAEQHARSAIDKFQNYSAAWVMLGVILDEQDKTQKAGNACSHAAAIDANYMPAYLCTAEFAVRRRDWEQALNTTEVALGLNTEGDTYAYYYRAVAYVHMNNLVEAKNSALRAMEFDANHVEPSIYFLLAQIYDRMGDNANAITKLHQFLKSHPDRQHQEEAEQYLAKLEMQASTK